jgi:glutamine cyclotransferase
MPKNNILKAGWGLAFSNYGDRNRLYATDGSNKISVIDPETWTHERTILVKKKGRIPVFGLNELEVIQTNDTTKKYIFANEFQTDNIHLIDLESGQVKKTWNLEELLEKQR